MRKIVAMTSAGSRSSSWPRLLIGSPEVDVTGITASGERVPVLRAGAWQI